jgi:hypothetical protein
MAAKQSHPERYVYSRIEKALARVYGADEAARVGQLRGWIQNLRKQGLSPKGPGSGRMIPYTRDDVDKWLIGLELELFDADPSTAVEFVNNHWGALSALVKEARASRRREDDVLLTVRFDSMAKTPSPLDVGYVTLRGFSSFGYWLADDRDEPRRASVFNLSARLRALDRALAEASKQEEAKPKLSRKAKPIVAVDKRRRGELP